MGIKDIVTIAFFPILLLLVPLIGMQFSDEVNWGPGDFIVAGALLLGTSFAIWLTLKKTSNLAYRSAMALAVMGGLLLIWINLAIGLIGHEGNPANLMYLAIFAVGIIGSGMARLKPKGMAGTMITAAVVQVLIAVIVLITGLISETGEPMLKVLLLNGIFVFLFCLSARLFWNAANSGIRTATSR